MNHYYLLLLLIPFWGCNTKQSKHHTNTNIEQIPVSLTNQQKEDKQTPNTDIALKFITDYLKFLNTYSGDSTRVDWILTNQDVTASFKEELQRMTAQAYEEDPEIGLGFDPILNTQDYPDDEFKLLDFDENSHFLTVGAKKWEGFKIRMKIKKVDNQWLVEGCGVINIPENEQVKI